MHISHHHQQQQQQQQQPYPLHLHQQQQQQHHHHQMQVQHHQMHHGPSSQNTSIAANLANLKPAAADADHSWRKSPEQAPLPVSGSRGWHSSTDPLTKQINGLLNKLTPENYDKLSDQLCAMQFAEDSNIKTLANALFTKAVSQPFYSDLFANLCQKLTQALDSPQPTEDQSLSNANRIKFRRCLLERCQEEFETRATGSAGNVDPNMPKNGTVQVTEEEKVVKARSMKLGVITFVGELYTHSMVSEMIIVKCVESLLENIYSTDDDNTKPHDATGKGKGKGKESSNIVVNEEAVEALCSFVTNVGKRLDATQKMLINDCLRQLRQLSGNASSRISFMILDLVDLRANNWVPRREVHTAKKLDQIKQDALREEIAQAQLLSTWNTAQSRSRSHSPQTARTSQSLSPSMHRFRASQPSAGAANGGGGTTNKPPSSLQKHHPPLQHREGSQERRGTGDSKRSRVGAETQQRRQSVDDGVRKPLRRISIDALTTLGPSQSLLSAPQQPPQPQPTQEAESGQSVKRGIRGPKGGTQPVTFGNSGGGGGGGGDPQQQSQQLQATYQVQQSPQPQQIPPQPQQTQTQPQPQQQQTQPPPQQSQPHPQQSQPHPQQSQNTRQPRSRTPAVPALNDLDPDTADQKREDLRNITRAYLKEGDAEGATQALTEFAATCSKWQPEMVVMVCEIGFDGDQIWRERIVELLNVLVMRRQISTSDLTIGLKDLVGILEDLSMDVPHAPQHLIDVLIGCVSSSLLARASVCEVLEALPPPYVERVFPQILRHLKADDANNDSIENATDLIMQRAKN